MLDIQKPLPLSDLAVRGETGGFIPLDETAIQTFAALLGFDGEARRLLKCALQGVLQTTAPNVAGITNKVSTGATENVTFPDTPITEVMIMANPSNSGDIWVNVFAAAGVDTGWPLDAGDIINFSINNLNELNLHIITSGDKAIIVRTV